MFCSKFRLPTIVWRHPVNRAVLLRSSGFHSKGFIGMIMKGQATNSNPNENNQSVEQEKFMQQIARLSRVFSQNNNTSSDIASAYFNSKAASESVSASNKANKAVYSNTPITNRRSLFASKIEKAVSTIKNINNPSASMSSSSSEHIHQCNVYTSNVPINPNCANTLSLAYNSRQAFSTKRKLKSLKVC